MDVFNFPAAVFQFSLSIPLTVFYDRTRKSEFLFSCLFVRSRMDNAALRMFF